MEKIDLVIVGAEGVVESGGIINKVSTVWPQQFGNLGGGKSKAKRSALMIFAQSVTHCCETSLDKGHQPFCLSSFVSCLNLLQVGTYQAAVMAKALNKPFYVVAESFKFVRLYPLKQSDIRNVEKVRATLIYCRLKCCCCCFLSVQHNRVGRELASLHRLYATSVHHSPIHRPGCANPLCG